MQYQLLFLVTAHYEKPRAGRFTAPVLFQVSLFVDNEQLLRVKDQFGRAMYLNSRISPDTVIPLDRTVPRYLDLHECIIIGNNGDQVGWVFTITWILHVLVEMNDVGWLTPKFDHLFRHLFSTLVMMKSKIDCRSDFPERLQKLYI